MSLVCKQGCDWLEIRGCGLGVMYLPISQGSASIERVMCILDGDGTVINVWLQVWHFKYLFCAKLHFCIAHFCIVYMGNLFTYSIESFHQASLFDIARVDQLENGELA